MSSVLLIATVACVVANAFIAVADYARAPFVLANSAEVGLPAAAVPYLATLKLAGAAGLLMGLLGMHRLGLAAGIGLTALFVGAVLAHVAHASSTTSPSPAPTCCSQSPAPASSSADYDPRQHIPCRARWRWRSPGKRPRKSRLMTSGSHCPPLRNRWRGRSGSRPPGPLPSARGRRPGGEVAADRSCRVPASWSAAAFSAPAARRCPGQRERRTLSTSPDTPGASRGRPVPGRGWTGWSPPPRDGLISPAPRSPRSHSRSRGRVWSWPGSGPGCVRRCGRVR